jgi:peroxiredoxin
MRAKFLNLAIVFCALLSAGAAQADAVIGQAAPALVSPTLDGKKFDLAELKGKVVVVHFWATWCAPCREEMPALESVWRQFHGKGLEVLAISVDRPRARADVDQVMHYFTFPAALSSAVTKNELATIENVPVTYVIDKDGKVENILTPDITPLTEAGLGEEVKNLIETQAQTASETKPEPKADTKADAKP